MTKNELKRFIKRVAVHKLNNDWLHIRCAAFSMVAFEGYKMSFAEIDLIAQMAQIIVDDIKAQELPTNVQFSVDDDDIVAYKCTQRKNKPNEVIWLKVVA